MVNTGGNGEVGISKVTAEVAKVIAQVPPVLESLTGLKMETLMEQLRSAPSPVTDTPVPPAERPPISRPAAGKSAAPKPES
jgi:flotillin